MLGTVLFFNKERNFGRIQPDDGSAPIYVHVSGLLDQAAVPKTGDRVEYEIELPPNKGPRAIGVHLLSTVHVVPAPENRNCFVVMPYGRTPEEIRWFGGWYKLVIDEAVRAAGFEPILAAAQDRPDAINDEIRAHLAFDPMVVVDLGGIGPDAEPNPNVMYELGIRHAFNLPHVIMAWAGQRLPFDISNQRTIMERRDLIDVPINRERLTKFIKEAALGNHYRPMDAVGRAATLEMAEQRLGTGSVLGALVEEVRDLRTRFTDPRPFRQLVPLKEVLGGKQSRKTLFEKFIAAGGTQAQWNKLLQKRVDRSLVSAPDKGALLMEMAKQLGALPSAEASAAGTPRPEMPTSSPDDPVHPAVEPTQAGDVDRVEREPA